MSRVDRFLNTLRPGTPATIAELGSIQKDLIRESDLDDA